MHINFQTIEIQHLALLHRWFMQPHVTYWWPEPQEFDTFYAKWSERINTGLSAYHTPWHGHIIEIDTLPIGYIHHYQVKKDRYTEYPTIPNNAIGIDFFIGEQSHIGKKLSAPVLGTYMDTVIKKQNPDVNTVIIDPAVTNTRAIHVYTKAGFKPLGVFNQSQGTALLMYKHI